MIVGGFGGGYKSDAQIVDLSSQTRSCNNFQDYPSAIDYATGAIVSGQPIVCGGESYRSGSGYNYYSECYKYSKGKSINDVQFFFLCVWGGSSKIGQNLTRGVGSLSKIGHSIILVFSQKNHNMLS